MPSPTPRTVLVYSDGAVFVMRTQALTQQQVERYGEQPIRRYNVRASSDSSAVMEALAEEVAQQHVTLDQTTFTNLDRIARKTGATHTDIATKAINTYAALKGSAHEDSVYFKAPSTNGERKLVVKRLVLP